MRNLLLFVLLVLSIPSRADDSFPIPEGYVLQKLDVTDGKIAMPKDWYYANGGTSSGWTWTFSKEDPSKGPYETGLRIQLIGEIEKRSKSSPEAFIQKLIEKKMASAKVLSQCEPSEQGIFMRQCLEVEENAQGSNSTKSYHILYSFFWAKDMDIVVINTFGATPDKWESIKPIVDAMFNIELIGPNFGK